MFPGFLFYALCQYPENLKKPHSQNMQIKEESLAGQLNLLLHSVPTF